MHILRPNDVCRVLQQLPKYLSPDIAELRSGGKHLLCGSRTAASWWTVQPRGKTPAATKSEAAFLELPSMVADVFPTSQTSPEEACARLLHSKFFPPFLNPAISSLACHPRTVQCGGRLEGKEIAE